MQLPYYNKTINLIIAVSGGIDSMVLLHKCMQTSNINAVVAHCNYNLRPESNTDADFVKAFCQQHNIPFYCKAFNTKTISQQQKLSIQETARNLRYQWFETLRQELNFDYIATAHHLNDNIETVLFNLVKGTGIKGLRGLPQTNQNVIRPLLSYTKLQLSKYANKNKLNWITDQSNFQDKYSRNKIRLNVINELKTINPSLEKTFQQHFKRFTEIETFINSAQSQLEKNFVKKQNEQWHIATRKLNQFKGKHTFLFNLLSPLGFTPTQINNILTNLTQTESGKQFLSNTHRIIKDRNELIITKLSNEQTSKIVIEKLPVKIKLNNKKLQAYLKPVNKIAIKQTNQTAYLNADKLEFPLVLRKWQQGDYFYPFGMYSENGKAKKKKVSKFFKDQKLSLLQKEQVWILESNQKIVWIVGYRTDDRFKVTPKTKQVAEITIR